MELALHRFDLPCRHPFTIARGTTTVQSTLIVELEQDGLRGYGEAPADPYYHATVENVAAALEAARSRIEAFRLGDPAELWSWVRPLLADSTFAQCALDVAAHDLWGKLHGKPVWDLWGLDPHRSPPSDYTIGIDSIDVMVRKLAEFPGFPVYKIKLGTADDLAIVRRLRRHTDATFRIDANCAWTVLETLQNAVALRDLDVEFIEQPLKREDAAAMKQVYRDSVLPLVADESCQTEADVQRCAECFHGVNIKLVKCGGLVPARRMIDEARRLGLRVMLGCFTESTVGISGIAQLLPLADYADLDGALLLAEDPADGVRVDRGRVIFPPTPGCGVTLRP